MRSSLLTVETLLGASNAIPGMLESMPRAEGPRVAPKTASSVGTRDDGLKPLLGPRPGDVRSPCPGLDALANLRMVWEQRLGQGLLQLMLVVLVSFRTRRI